ncbi:MAG: nickel-dependent hydrogenase large subunit [Candidatus Micrarchaeota archaeon]
MASKTIWPVGPQHPAIDEPIFLKLELEGSTVKDVELNLGYVHRGIEKLVEGKLIETALYTVERVCGICSHSHANPFTEAVESVLEIDVPAKVKYQRTIIGELERMHSHLLWSAVMMRELGFETEFMFFMHEREKVLDVFEELTGNRLFHALNFIGTSRVNFMRDDLIRAEKKLDIDVEHYERVVKNQRGVVERLKGVGKISKETALEYGLVGPVARASGVEFDVRKADKYDAYGNVEFKLVAREEGDAYARMLVRFHELKESKRILEQVFASISYDEGIPKRSDYQIVEGVGMARIEAPRGENFHFVAIEQNKVKRVKIRTPTLANILMYSELLKGADVTDVPVIIASLDPCFGCLERVLVVEDGREENLSGREFKEKFKGAEICTGMKD